MKAIVIPALLTLLASGCAPFAPRFDVTPSTSVSSVAPAVPNGPVALVLSEDSKKTERYLEAYRAHYVSGWTHGLYADAVRRAYVETSDPGYSVRGVEQALGQRFGEVRRFDSLAEAQASGAAVIARLDVRTRLIDSRASDPASELTLSFYDRALRPLGALAARDDRQLSPLWSHAKREQEVVEDLRAQGDVQARALASLQERIADLTVN